MPPFRPNPAAFPSQENQFHAEHVRLLLRSYEHWRGFPLLNSQPGDDPTSLAKQIYDAPFVVLSHDTNSDPMFNYGNRQAQALFELGWSDLVQLPSRLSAEPMNREERARLLDTVSRQGWISDYAGMRITATGRRFWIPQATVWNILDSQGTLCGQAATFDKWEFQS